MKLIVCNMFSGLEAVIVANDEAEAFKTDIIQEPEEGNAVEAEADLDLDQDSEGTLEALLALDDAQGDGAKIRATLEDMLLQAYRLGKGTS